MIRSDTGPAMRLLKEVARRLKGVVRDIDTVARLGGDEFVLIVSPGPNRDLVHKVANRIIEALQARCGSRRSRSIHRRVSASRFIRTTARPSRICSLMLTRQCIAPSSAAATMFSFSESGMNTATQEKVKLESDLHARTRTQTNGAALSAQNQHDHGCHARRGGVAALAAPVRGNVRPPSSFRSPKNAG